MTPSRATLGEESHRAALASSSWASPLPNEESYMCHTRSAANVAGFRIEWYWALSDIERWRDYSTLGLSVIKKKKGIPRAHDALGSRAAVGEDGHCAARGVLLLGVLILG